MTDTKEDIIKQAISEFKPYFSGDHPVRVAMVLAEWFYPRGDVRNPYRVRCVLNEWSDYVTACKNNGYDIPPIPPVLVKAVMELNHAELIGKKFSGQTYKKLIEETKWSDIFAGMYKAIAMGYTQEKAAQMVALSLYKQNGCHVVHTASTIDKYFHGHHNAPGNTDVCATVVRMIQDAMKSDKSIQAGWLEDKKKFEELEKDYEKELPGVYGVRR